MSKEELKEFWKAIAHQINNATANITLEISTLQMLLEALEGPKEHILRILKSLDLSVDVVSAALQEMEAVWQKLEQAEAVDLKSWEEDFRRRIVQLKQKELN